jgi:hypothetical protein
MSAGPVSLRTWPGTLTVFDRDSEGSHTAPSFLSWSRQEGGREMVKQRFLTHFKPWLVAVIKVTGLIVAYQLFDQFRTYFQYASLSIANVVSGATALLLVIGLLCMIAAWGEWCWFTLRRLRWFFRKFGEGSRANRTARAIEMLQPVTKRMF